MKVARDTWLAFQRAFYLQIHSPILVAVTIAQPLIFLLLLGPLLKNALRGVPPAQVFNVYVPGLMVQLVLFGSLYAGFSLMGELNTGVIERFQVTPISRISLLFGRTLRDTVILLLQGTMIAVLAVPFGLRLGLTELAEMLGVMMLLAFTLSPLSYALALILRRDEVLGPLINLLTVPLLLLSGIVIPMSYAPAWLHAFSRINPLTEVVEGGRQVFAGHLWDGSVALAVLLAAALAAVSLTLVGRLFQRAAR